MPIRPIARTNNTIMTMRVTPQENLTLFAEGRINGGMVTVIDSAEIKTSQLVLAKNVTIRYDKTSRRPGFTQLMSGPNAQKVLMYIPVTRFDTSVSVFRFSNVAIHIQNVSSWTQLTGTLSGGVDDRFNFTAIDDRFFFTNNGRNNLKELSFGGLSFADVNTNLEYRYVTSFFDRVVVANYGKSGDENPVQIAWSGALNFTQFNPLVDISAGSTVLIESQADYADEITGIFGFATQMLIIRKFSLWGATKQPVATNPFFFYTAVPNIGSDAPYSVQQIPNGLMWYDKRTSMVYEYLIGQQEPVPVGVSVSPEITQLVGNPRTVFSSYDPLEDEYLLNVPLNSSSIVRQWVYNRRTKAWSYSEYENLSSVTNTAFTTSSLKINDLIGKINDLVGKIDSLSPSVEGTARFLGFTDGVVAKVNPLDNTDNGVPALMCVVSKTFVRPVVDFYVGQLRVEYFVKSAGNFNVSYSKDNGLTWTLYKTVTFNVNDIGRRKLATFIKNIKCRQFNWKLESSSGIFDLIGYEVHDYPGAVSKK